LYGDPTKPGVFVTRVKFSAGWKDPPHWHPDEVRTVVVLSGTFYFGSGDKWDESKFKAYPAGTFYSEPSKAPHYTWAKDGEVIIQITGVGPSGTHSSRKRTNSPVEVLRPPLGRPAPPQRESPVRSRAPEVVSANRRLAAAPGGLLDHVVGDSEQRRRDREPQHLRRSGVDDELELSRL
jgi:quercetin dioxygenase-like cupin family protein